MTLCNLIRKVYSGSILVAVDDIVGKILEALYNFLLNCREDYVSLPKYMELSDHKFKVLKATGFAFAATKIRDSYITEL